MTSANISTNKSSMFNKLNTQASSSNYQNKTSTSYHSIQVPAKPKDTHKNKTSKNFNLLLFVGAIVLAVIAGTITFAYLRTFKSLKKVGLDVTPTQVANLVINSNPFSSNYEGYKAYEDIVKEQGKQLKKDSSGKHTNFLVVGIDTRIEDGKSKLLNTDTLVVISYNHETNEAVFISIPRDYYTKIPNSNSYGKINSIYALNEEKTKGTGLDALQDAVETNLGIEIQYYGMFNFIAFEYLLNKVGTIEVEVENTFTDYLYPTGRDEPPLYETVHFEKGRQIMDAETALKFARSRKSADNGEGSDYARAKRQQKIIWATLDKFLEQGVYTKPNKIITLIQQLENNIRLSGWTMDDIEAGLVLKEKIKTLRIHNYVLDPTLANGQILTSRSELRKIYAITPVKGKGNYEDLQLVTQKIIEYPEIYSSMKIIYIYDVSTDDKGKSLTKNLIEEFPFHTFSYQGISSYYIDYTAVFNNGSRKDEDTNDFVNIIANQINGRVISKPTGLEVPDTADIVVLYSK